MNSWLSSDFEFETFLQNISKHPHRAFKERRYAPVELVQQEEFDAETDRLLAEIRAVAS